MILYTRIDDKYLKKLKYIDERYYKLVNNLYKLELNKAIIKFDDIVFELFNYMENNDVSKLITKLIKFLKWMNIIKYDDKKELSKKAYYKILILPFIIVLNEKLNDLPEEYIIAFLTNEIYGKNSFE